MDLDEHFHEDWKKFFDLKVKFFSELGMFKWARNLRWRMKFPLGEDLPCLTLQGGLLGLRHLFLYLADMYCYAAAAEKIAKDHEVQGDKDSMAFWRYRIRNYHIYDFIPRYFSFLDHAAHVVASLSEWKLVMGSRLEKKGTMYYGTFVKLLEESLSSADQIGFLGQQDRSLFFKFLKTMDIEPKDPKLNKLGRNFRQDSAHLFFPGIDHMIRFYAPEFEKKGKNKSFNVVAYGMGAAPDYRFDELEKFASTALKAVDESSNVLFQTEIMQFCLSKNDA